MIKKIFHTSIGFGEPIVFLHGGMGLDSSYLNNSILRRLKTYGYKLIFFDFSGNGYSLSSADKNTIDYWLDDIEVIKRTYSLDKFTLFGHSYGGFMALKYAIKNPENIKNLILVSTAPYSKTYLNHKNIKGQFVNSQDDLKNLTKKAFPDYFSDPQKSIFLSDISYNATSYNASLTEMTKYDVRNDLNKISSKTLIIVGDRETNYLQRAKLLKSKIKNSKLEIIKNAGHFSFFDQPKKFNNLILDFLAGS